MSQIEHIKFADGIYTSVSHIFVGLECGIVFSYFLRLSSRQLEKMSMIELYVRLLVELIIMSVMIYWYVPVFNYFGMPFDGMHEYRREDHPTINSNVLFAIAFLIGNKSLSEKVTAIIDKAGYADIPLSESY
jgi:hypothetical protein